MGQVRHVGHVVKLRLSLFCAAWIFLLGCASTQEKLREETGASALPSHIVEGCRILNGNGDLLWSYPAAFCIFFPDGKFVAASADSISLVSGNRTFWEKKIPVHHMLALTSKNEIAVLSDEFINMRDWAHRFESFREAHFKPLKFCTGKDTPERLKNDKLRTDKIVLLNLRGEVVAERRFLGEPDYPMPLLVENFATNVRAPRDLEVSHMNSIYEIGENTSSIPAFKRGNFIVNDTLNRRIFILDEKLKGILWTKSYGLFGFGQAHDAQILPNGNLLVFKNFTVSPGDESSLEEVDPQSLMPAWRYFEKSSGEFRAPIQGSVQRLRGGRTLFTFRNIDSKKSFAKLIDRDGRELKSFDLSKHSNIAAQGAYEINVEEFLKNAGK